MAYNYSSGGGNMRTSSNRSNPRTSNMDSRQRTSNMASRQTRTCPPGQHMMPPTNGRPGYCMNDSDMMGEGYGTPSNTPFNNTPRPVPMTRSVGTINRKRRPLRINNANDVRNLTGRPKRFNTNSNHNNAGYGMGGMGGGNTVQSYCPPSCPPGQCCVPGHYSGGEVVNGRAVGNQTWNPPACGPCGGGGTIGGRGRVR